jgi:hypothetical protein
MQFLADALAYTSLKHTGEKAMAFSFGQKVAFYCGL